MKSSQKDAIYRMMLIRTEELEVKLAELFEEKKKPDVAPEVRHVQEVLDSVDFGCNHSMVVKLISAVVGAPLVDKKATPTVVARLDRVPFLAVVVPLSNPNSHSYVNGEPVIAIVNSSETEGFTAVRKDGRVGNYLSYKFPKSYRPATKKEIENLPEVQLERAAESIIFV